MQKNKNGFTLVELAIVLMIIGLLIGGVLRGQELMNNARVNATIEQAKAYQAALVTFKDAYSALPGDMTNPGVRLPDCTTAPCNAGGDGDGLIGQMILFVGAADFTGNNSEQRKFWLHLAVAHLITGIDPSVTAMTGSFGEWGKQYPAAKTGGGFQVGFYSITTGDPNWPNFSGHFLTLQHQPGPFVLSDFSTTVAQSAQLDRKMDDGMPHTGSVIGVANFDENSCVSPTTGLYNENLSATVCNLLIKLD
jgi:prepilin-type N-terminal cleavage/methylation domain-containing protein